jgi:hypothetical protein
MAKKPEAAPAPTIDPEKLLDLPEGFEIWRVSPLSLKEQNKNARVQSNGTFKSLVRNVKKRGALEGLPFCARTGTEFWIISGHHRVRAAIQAGLASIIVLCDPSARTRGEIVAKQVAHNSINGSDDPAVLLQLLDEIDDVDAMLEASVDRDAIEKLASAPANASDVAVDYDWKLVTFAFLPKHIKDLEQLCAALGASDLVLTTEIGAHDQLVAAMKQLGKADEIRSLGAVVYRMVEVTNEYLKQKATAAAPAPEQASATP